MGNRSPGLWEAVGSTVRTRRTATGGGFFVADCWRKWDEPVEFAFDGNEADDNARFIAAAPEMEGCLLSIESRPAEAMRMMEREGFVFDGTGGRWEKLALSFYTMLVIEAERARHVFEDMGDPI